MFKLDKSRASRQNWVHFSSYISEEDIVQEWVIIQTDFKS